MAKRKYGQRLLEFFDIPLDTAADWPRVVLSGNQSLLVQNHAGVIEYDQNLARINTKLGELKVVGSGLVLVSALKDEIMIRGKIQRVELVDWR